MTVVLHPGKAVGIDDEERHGALAKARNGGTVFYLFDLPLLQLLAHAVLKLPDLALEPVNRYDQDVGDLFFSEGHVKKSVLLVEKNRLLTHIDIDQSPDLTALELRFGVYPPHRSFFFHTILVKPPGILSIGFIALHIHLDKALDNRSVFGSKDFYKS